MPTATDKLFDALKGLISVAVATTVLSVVGICLLTLDLWLVEKYSFKLFTAWYAANLIDKRVIFGIAGLSILVAVACLLGISRLVPRFAKYTLTPPIGTDDKIAFTKWLVLLLASFVVAVLFLFVLVVVVGERGILDNFPRVVMTVSDNVDTSSNDAGSSKQTFAGSARLVNDGTNEYRVTGEIETSNSEPKDGQAVKPERLDGLLLSHDTEYWYVLDDAGEGKGNIRTIALDEASNIAITY